ncbi:glycoside hydrolase family 16 protein [Actinomadura fulvescens]|uniref:GH16 domain-containing protein n=1 Tax=Actinomadura fulvescens TaxID=46160 RepID=A0ABN3PAL5_9ACTN
MALVTAVGLTVGAAGTAAGLAGEDAPGAGAPNADAVAARAAAGKPKITLPKVKWKRTWSDEFNGRGRPTAKWRAAIGNGKKGWTHRALQYYRWENASLTGKGQLVISANKEPRSTKLKCWYGPCKYTSARLQTNGKFAQRYGRFAIRAKLPTGQGMWPAFWMQRSAPYGEIDVIETIGKYPKLAQGWAHDGRKRRGGGKLQMRQPLSAGFHTYGVDWTPWRIVWWVDGKPYAQMKRYKGWPFDKAHYLILSLQVGGNWPGSPSAKTRFPQRMQVDWVRAYRA